MSKKDSAFNFLRSLEEYLNSSIPGPYKISSEIKEIVEKAKSSIDNETPYLKRPEEAFLNSYVAPAIHKFLSTNIGLGGDGAKRAYLSENYRHIRDWATGTPARSKKHPFTKAVGNKPQLICEQWKGNGPGYPVVQSCPDMALRSPCPHKVVIEGKYFSKGGPQAAETALVTNIYQAFFYRALPYIPESPKHPAWDYDYACFLAYDATEKGWLKKAWELLDKRVKEGCWEGANIYVMILRGRNIVNY